MNITHTVEDQYKENELEIEETKAHIRSLELRLERLTLRNRVIGRFIAGERRHEATEEEQEAVKAERFEATRKEPRLISTGVRDSNNKFIFVGERVRLETSSKNNPVFTAGSTSNIVTGTTNDKPERFVKIRSLADNLQTTKRKGKHVTIYDCDEEK